MKTVFIRKVPMSVFLNLQDGKNLSDNARYLNTITGYPYIIFLIKRFEEIGLVILSKKRRSKFVYLTQNGKLIQSYLLKLSEADAEKIKIIERR